MINLVMRLFKIVVVSVPMVLKMWKIFFQVLETFLEIFLEWGGEEDPVVRQVPREGLTSGICWKWNLMMLFQGWIDPLSLIRRKPVIVAPVWLQNREPSLLPVALVEDGVRWSAPRGFSRCPPPVPIAGGADKSLKNPCKQCHGSGRKKVTKKITVTVPKGVETGTLLRLSGKGEGGVRNGPSGDLYVEIYVLSHSQYKRQGQDLFGKIKISYTQILLGTEVEVETFDGKKSVKVPEGSQPGSLLRLQRLGVPDLRTEGRGDICLRLEVEFPKKLKKRKKNCSGSYPRFVMKKCLKRKKKVFLDSSFWRCPKPKLDNPESRHNLKKCVEL